MLNKMPVGIPGCTGEWRTPSRPRVGRGINQAQGSAHSLPAPPERDQATGDPVRPGTAGGCCGRGPGPGDPGVRSQTAEPALPTRQLLPPAPADLQLGGETSPCEPDHPDAGTSCAGLGTIVIFTPLVSLSPLSGRTLGARLLPTLHRGDPHHQHLPHLPAAGAGQAALLLP